MLALSRPWKRVPSFGRGAIGSATVSPATATLRAVTAPFLALMGRGLAARGEFLAAIEVTDAGVVLLPAASWDVRGREPDPMQWLYRLDLSGPSRTVTVDRLAESVLHVRLADPQSPWRGRSPLTRSDATAELAAHIEASLEKEARIPMTRIAPAPLTQEQLKDYVFGLKQGGLVATAAGHGPVGDQMPSNRWTPATLHPEPDQVMEALRTRTGHDNANAYGVPPALFESRGDGAGQRESWRRFWAGTIAPLGRCIETEVQAKLEPAARVSFEALSASDEDGRSGAVSRRATAFKTFLDAGIRREEAMGLAALADG